MKLSEVRKKLEILEKIQAELKQGYRLELGFESVYLFDSIDNRVSSAPLSNVTEDSFAAYRVQPFRMVAILAESGREVVADDIGAAKDLLDSHYHQSVDITINGKLYEFRRNCVYLINGRTVSRGYACVPASLFLQELKHGDSVTFANLGPIGDFETETVKL